MHITHGLCYTPEYHVWQDMRKRCDNPNCHCYPDYGGRGITYDPSWSTFESFIADMGERPTPLHTIDRIDVNGNYSPTNCVWATRSQQALNRRQYFQRPVSPMRYIRQTKSGSYKVTMTIVKGKRIARYFKSLTDALLWRADIEMEREMFRVLYS